MVSSTDNSRRKYTRGNAGRICAGRVSPRLIGRCFARWRKSTTDAMRRWMKEKRQYSHMRTSHRLLVVKRLDLCVIQACCYFLSLLLSLLYFLPFLSLFVLSALLLGYSTSCPLRQNVTPAKGGPIRFLKTISQSNVFELDNLPRQAQSFQLDTSTKTTEHTERYAMRPKRSSRAGLSSNPDTRRH